MSFRDNYENLKLIYRLTRQKTSSVESMNQPPLFFIFSCPHVFLDVHNAPSKQRWKNPIKKSPIINWAMHKKTTGSTKSNSIDGHSGGK